MGTTEVVDAPTETVQPDETGRRRMAAPIAVIISVALLGTGGLLARFLPDTETAATPTPTITAAAPPPSNSAVLPPLAGATRMDGLAPVGYTHDQAGAVAAATNYVGLLDGSVAMLLPEPREQIISSVVADANAAEYRDTLGPILDSTATALGVQPDGSLIDGVLALRVTPLAYSVPTYTEQDATITVWYSSLTGVASDTSPYPVQADYFTANIGLTWERDDWKWTTIERGDGPSPVANSDAALVSTSAEMVAALTGMTPYVYGGIYNAGGLP